MKYIYKILIVITSLTVMTFISCKKDEENSSNSPYDNAKGLWYYSDSCSGEFSEIFSEILPDNFFVEGQGDGQLVFTMLDTININATIDSDGNIIIPSQEIFSIDTVIIIPLTIPFTVSGYGMIESYDSGSLNLTYSMDLLGSFSCVADLFREEPIYDEEE